MLARLDLLPSPGTEVVVNPVGVSSHTAFIIASLTNRSIGLSSYVGFNAYLTRPDETVRESRKVTRVIEHPKGILLSVDSIDTTHTPIIYEPIIDRTSSRIKSDGHVVELSAPDFSWVYGIAAIAPANVGLFGLYAELSILAGKNAKFMRGMYSNLVKPRKQTPWFETLRHSSNASIQAYCPTATLITYCAIQEIHPDEMLFSYNVGKGEIWVEAG